MHNEVAHTRKCKKKILATARTQVERSREHTHTNTQSMIQERVPWVAMLSGGGGGGSSGEHEHHAR